MENKDSRYPYTYACDYLRSVNPNISRSEISQIRHMIADVLGMPDEELAIKLAIAYQSMESQAHIFKDDKEIFPVPKDAVSFRITTFNGRKVALWLAPKTIHRCMINECNEPAEQINTPIFSSGTYCRKHFEEINIGKK